MRVLRFWARAVAVAAVVPLAGCDHVPDAVNPVAWYQDVSGASKNQAVDANQRNQQNLEAGSKQPYPNLATVPNVPSGATSTVDRQKLVDSLIADRRNAQYNNERLEAGSQLASLAPPPPPAAAAPSGGASATTALNPPSPPPAQANATAPVKSAVASRGREAPPAESSLTSPTIPSVPKGEAPPPPPAPAQVTRTAPPAAPVIAPTTPSPPASAKATSPPLTAPAGVRAGGSPSLAMRTPANAANPVSVSVGDIAFAQGSSNLAETQRSALAEIAGLYKQTGGQIRVVGHSEPGSGTDAARQRIAALDLALDRADAVAQALARLGVPVRDIRVEAAPAKVSERPRAEVFMEY